MSTDRDTSSSAGSPCGEVKQAGTKSSQDLDELDSDLKSHFLTEQPLRNSVRLTSVLLNYAHPPGLNLVPLGTAWSLDPLARLNNAARRAFLDLFNMIDGMQRRVHDLRTADLLIFFKWWKLFASFNSVVLASYESVIIPWLLSSKSSEKPDFIPDLMIAQAQSHSKILDKIISSFDTIYKQTPRRAPDETLARIIKSTSDVKPIIAFYAAVESTFPPVIEHSFNQTEVKSFERRLVTFLHKTGVSQIRRMHLHIVARSMTDESISAWHKLIPPLTRISYQTYTSKFQTTYVAVVNTLASS